MRKIGIVGGTGIENPDTLKGFETKIIETPYGKALCNIGEMSGNLVAFLSRHGVDHSVAPHMINYRANIWALKSLGITEVFATSATGSLNPNMKAGHFVVCDQLMDFTKNRISTFYDNPIRGVAHADFTNPYCETLRQKAIAILKKTDITFHEKGCYVCTDGPRFETAAEVRAYAMLGGDVIGMTNAQVLADAKSENFDPERKSAAQQTTLGYKTTGFVDPIIWEIRRERRMEFFMEQYRVLDIRRWGQLELMLGANNPDLLVGGYVELDLAATLTEEQAAELHREPQTTNLKKSLDNVGYNLLTEANSGKVSIRPIVGYNADGTMILGERTFFKVEDDGSSNYAEMRGFLVPMSIADRDPRNVDVRNYLEPVCTQVIDQYKEKGHTITQNPGWE